MTEHSDTMKLKELTRTLRVLWHAGEPLNISAVKRRHPALIRAAYAIKPFLGWKGALEAAGIDYARIKVEILHTLTCEICGKEIGALSHHLRCLHNYSTKEYQQEFPDAPHVTELAMSKAMHRSRRGREKPRALIPHWEPLWTPEYVLDRIHELHRRGFRINQKAVYRGENLANVATKHFGSWNAALEALGLSPDRIRLRHPVGYWTKPLILRGIRSRKKSGAPLTPVAMRNEPKTGTPLYSAAVVVFGSWKKAIEAAGLDYTSIRLTHPARYPTRQAVIAEIRRRRREGQPLNITAVESGPFKDCALCGAAQRRFSGWRHAIKAAGLDYKKIRAD